MLLFVAILEAGIRVFNLAPPYTLYFQQKKWALGEETTTKNIAVDSEPEGGWQGGLYLNTPSGKRLRPNVNGVIHNHRLSQRDIPIRTNALGFRGGTVSSKVNTRVLFLGDSITLSDYLEEEQTFVKVVEKLSESHKSPLETLNAGVGSIGIDNELSILRETGALVAPDLIVLNLYLNDVEPSPVVELIPLPTWLESSFVAQYIFHAASLVKYWLQSSTNSSISETEHNKWLDEIKKEFPGDTGNPTLNRKVFNAQIHSNVRDWGAAWATGAQEHILETVAQIQTESKNLGAKLLVVIFPVKLQVEAQFIANEPAQAFESKLKELGIPSLNLLAKLRETHSQDKQQALFFDHCHHTEFGSKVIAEAIFEFIQKNLNGNNSE